MKKVYLKTGSKKRDEWKLLPGEEIDECCKCKTQHKDGEHARRWGDGFSTNICTKCGCDEFYRFKFVG